MTDDDFLDYFDNQVTRESTPAPEPITIICGTPGRSVTFTADPATATVSIETDRPAGDAAALYFDVEEMGLIMALLIRVADGE